MVSAMFLSMTQQPKMQQTLRMTPQMQQAVRLLQLSHLELVQKVREELEENPFLEISQPQEEQQSPQPEEEKKAAPDENEVYDRDVAANADWEEYIGDFSSAPKDAGQREEAAEETLTLEQRLTERPTLSGHLLWQLHLSDFTEEEKAIGECIIGNLESNGRLTASNKELAALSGSTEAKVESMVQRIQLFDPVGVAARSLKESLLVQVKSRGLDADPVLVAIIKNHLEDLETGRVKAVKNRFKLDDDDLHEYISVIRSLEPMPGSDMGEGSMQYVRPDVTVTRVGDEFIITLNDEDVPPIGISEKTCALCARLEEGKKSGESAKDKAFFIEKYKDAKNLINGLEHRKSTLYKVMESIVRRQREFFEVGIKGLKPLILNDVAEDVNMHESNVSRITSSKYVSTQYGVFELKFFFNSGITSADGEESFGAESIKAQVKELIAHEDPDKPLSDDAIAQELKERLGLSIARRTVAKYREGLNIASSSKRKRRF